jgi:PKD repeat protein/acetyl esterase/lipase
MKKGLFFFTFHFLVLWANAQCLSNRYQDTIYPYVSKTTQVLYGNADPYLGSSQDVYLDFYEPTGDTLRYRPLIVYAFGGAFLIGDKNQPPVPEYCTHFAKAGYAVASIDYRIGFNTLSSGSCERAVIRAVQDLRAAIRFLSQRASQFGIDTSAIFLTGSSAGCIAGLHSAYMLESEVPVSAHGIPLEPNDLGCIDCSGNNDFNKRVPKPRGILNHWGAILDTAFITNLVEDNVPVLSIHGDADPLVPYEYGHPFSYPVFPNVYGSKPIHERLSQLGIKNELIPLHNYLHETWLTNREVLDTAFTREKPFLYSILKPTPQMIVGDTMVCIGTTTSYVARSENLSKYCFNLNGGGVILLQNENQIVVRWNSTGLHRISVREINKNDVTGDLAFLNVRVINRPKANFGINANILTVSCSDSSIGAISWIYNFQNNVSTTSQHPTYTYASPGVKQIRLIVSNGYCADTAFRSIDIDTCPKVFFNYTIIGDSIRFSANASNGVKYEWNFGDGTKDSSTLNPVHFYSTSQNYLVGLSITNSKGCKISSTQIISFSKPNGIANDIVALPFYPNPIKDILYISAKGTYQVYNIESKLVLEQSLNKDEALLLTTLSAGLYFVIDKNNPTSFFQFIKE